MIYSITEIEARYAETDKMGGTHHGNYATWFLSCAVGLYIEVRF